MKLKNSIEILVYTILIILSLAAVGLAVLSPTAFTDLKLVYGGF